MSCFFHHVYRLLSYTNEFDTNKIVDNILQWKKKRMRRLKRKRRKMRQRSK